MVDNDINEALESVLEYAKKEAEVIPFEHEVAVVIDPILDEVGLAIYYCNNRKYVYSHFRTEELMSYKKDLNERIVAPIISLLIYKVQEDHGVA